MSDRLLDFYQALTQRPRMNDQLSAEDQFLAYQRMLAQRGATGINTIDPGMTWNGFDKLAIQPDDIMSDSAYRRYRQEDI